MCFFNKQYKHINKY